MAKALILDNGLFVGLAARMARDQPVAYFSSWHNAFPRSREFAPGTGIPDVERVDDPVSYMLDGKASHVIIPDLYLDSYERLARELDIPVFGCGGGSRLETDRWFLKEFLIEHGLPVISSTLIKGVDALGEFLKENDDKYVKVSVFRGDHETEKHDDWNSTQHGWFNRLALRLGKAGDSVLFVVEDPIPDALEIGIDDFVFDGAFVLPAVLGVECKDAGYFGWVASEMPEQFGPLVNALGEYFKKSGYNNFFSNEMRITKDGTIFMTDATCRIPSPPGGVMMSAIGNFSNVVLKNESPDYGKARFLYEIVLKSDVVADDWLMVDFPKELADRYAFHNYCVRDGKVWIIPHDSKYTEFGSALGWGASKADAKEMCIESAKAATAYGLSFDEKVLEKAEKEVSESGFLSQ